jgi:hypothetical protein
LLARVQVTSYNSHLGLLRSEHWDEHRNSLLGPSRGRRRYGIKLCDQIALTRATSLDQLFLATQPGCQI